MTLKCNSYAIALTLAWFLSGSSLAASTTHFSAQEMSIIRAFGPWPMQVPDDPGNEYSGIGWAEQLGEKLFGDVELSGNSQLACSSCHQPTLGFGDGLATAVGKSDHKRNTQTLWNVGMQHWFGWDGGTDSLWSASLRPIFSDIEMDAELTSLSQRLRNKHYVIDGFRQSPQMIDVNDLADEELVVTIAKLIGAYTRTLVSGDTQFDRYRLALLDNDTTAQNDYPESAKRGLRLFIGEANCHVCHFGPNFSNGEFHDTGRPFFTGVGEVDPGRYSGIKRVRQDKYNLAGKHNGTDVPSEIRKTTSVNLGQRNFGEWRTPSLRNLSDTAPYMHDGSIATLRGVVDAYADIDPDRLHADGEAILKPLDLDEQARKDLVLFLETLSIPVAQ